MKVAEKRKLEKIPSTSDNSEIMRLVKNEIAYTDSYFKILKALTGLDDNEISEKLNISEKTFRAHKLSAKNVKPNELEQAILLISLYKHGIEVFGNNNKFNQWLEKPNFYFDNAAPKDLMNTTSGIKFIDDRLTAIEYGDNA